MSLWQSFKEWLKWKVAEEEMMELHRTRSMIQSYWRYNAEFHEVDHVFTMMDREIKRHHMHAKWEEKTRDALREYRKTGRKACPTCTLCGPVSTPSVGSGYPE